MSHNFSKKMIWVAAVFVVLGSAGSSALQAKMPLTNTLCPVMKGERAKEKFFSDYKGERINFCCKSCIKRFNKNPEEYLIKLHSSK